MRIVGYAWGMKVITLTISRKHDKILEAIAPRLLRGKRMTSRRVEWAIDRLKSILAPTKPIDQEDESTST